MHLVMSGLDYNRAPVSLREQLAFSKTQVVELSGKLYSLPGILGCVLLSTCNRTEAYLSVTDENIRPDELLCLCAGVDYAPFKQAFMTLHGDEAARHLMEVVCGLHSQIWGEDQILSQVKQAAAIAHGAGVADAVLKTLFRIAASAGKEVKSRAKLTKLPVSAAYGAIEALKTRMGSLEGQRAMVIGNGEMGKFAAGLLCGSSSDVTVTLRSYHRGDVTAPRGCRPVPYDERYAAMSGMDFLISATASPHYTVTAQEFQAVQNPPKYLLDLAIPRDIEPDIGNIDGITLLNMDDFGVARESILDPTALVKVHAILDKHMQNFARWNAYRESIPALEDVKSAIAERMKTVYSDAEQQELIDFTVGRTVELLAGRLDTELTPEKLYDCSRKIRKNTRRSRVKRI